MFKWQLLAIGLWITVWATTGCSDNNTDSGTYQPNSDLDDVIESISEMPSALPQELVGGWIKDYTEIQFKNDGTFHYQYQDGPGIASEDGETSFRIAEEEGYWAAENGLLTFLYGDDLEGEYITETYVVDNGYFFDDFYLMVKTQGEGSSTGGTYEVRYDETVWTTTDGVRLFEGYEATGKLELDGDTYSLEWKEVDWEIINEKRMEEINWEELETGTWTVENNTLRCTPTGDATYSFATIISNEVILLGRFYDEETDEPIDDIDNPHERFGLKKVE